MPRLDRLPQINRNNLLMLPVQVNDTTPFTRPPRLLSACRLAIVTTAGLHRRDDRPFGPGDQSYRVIASDTATADIVQSHTSLGFDRQASAIAAAAAISEDPALETSQMRRYHEQWLAMSGGRTAAGQVLRRVRDRLDASDAPRWKAAAFGVAR